MNQKMLLDCVTEIRDMQKLIETELHSSITMIESFSKTYEPNGFRNKTAKVTASLKRQTDIRTKF